MPAAVVPSADPAARRPDPAARRRLTAGIVLMMLLCCALLGGCTRVRTALAVQGDDTVTGDVVVAKAGGPPPVISPPAPLVGRVSVAPYAADDYQGSRLQFSGLRFDEVNSLIDAVPAAQGRYKLALRRAGSRIMLNGQVDLAAVPVDKADVQLKVALPGEVVSTDGKLEDTTVWWVFQAGRVTEFSAVVAAPDPAAPSVARWTALVAAIVAAAAVGAVLLAKANRNPPVRPAGRGP